MARPAVVQPASAPPLPPTLRRRSRCPTRGRPHGRTVEVERRPPAAPALADVVEPRGLEDRQEGAHVELAERIVPYQREVARGLRQRPRGPPALRARKASMWKICSVVSGNWRSAPKSAGCPQPVERVGEPRAGGVGEGDLQLGRDRSERSRERPATAAPGCSRRPRRPRPPPRRRDANRGCRAAGLRAGGGRTPGPGARGRARGGAPGSSAVPAHVGGPRPRVVEAAHAAQAAGRPWGAGAARRLATNARSSVLCTRALPARAPHT